MESPTKRQRKHPREVDNEKLASTCVSCIDLLDDPILREIIEFLPDPETVCTFGSCSTRLRTLVKEETAIWDRFLGQIPVRARPKAKEGAPEPTAQDIVLRFSSARLFASRMERLLPLHRVEVGKDNPRTGRYAFPDANGLLIGLNKAWHGRKDVVFVRYSLSGSLLWQGFLPFRSELHNLVLDNEDDEFDLSEEFDWPELKAYLAYPPPRDQFGSPDFDSARWGKEKRKRASALFKNLTLTIVVIKDDITDRDLGICTHGTDGERFGSTDYFIAPRMQVMEIGSRVNSMNAYVKVGHIFENNYSYATTESLPQKYVGPVWLSYF